MYLKYNGKNCLDILAAKAFKLKDEKSGDFKNIIECIKLVVKNTRKCDFNKLKKLSDDLPIPTEGSDNLKYLNKLRAEIAATTEPFNIEKVII